MFDALRQWSPHFGQILDSDPSLEPWLEREIGREWRRSDLEAELAVLDSAEPLTVRLRRLRRRTSLRIAAREVEDRGPVTQSLGELTRLAEFVLGKLLGHLQSAWVERLGRPWDDEQDREARFCVLGLGKLGGGELNFCSDLDLIYIYEGDGHCRRGERSTTTTTAEFFSRLAHDLTAQLHQRTGDGFLYNIDLRLRPEGDSGPIVRSIDAMEHYYYVAGQTWERLALVKARTVAGMAGPAGELFERLNPFRFPRHPPPRLLEAIAGVKLRTEREVVGTEDLERHLKSGRGGIREIEFFVQALQMLNGGRNPFLQEPSTLAAIEKLDRYGVISSDRAQFLRAAYCRLRRLENLVQIREEKQTHLLPRDPARLALLSQIGPLEGLDADRERVRTIYRELIPEVTHEAQLADWTVFLSGPSVPPGVKESIQRWFGDDAAANETLRDFAAGEGIHVLSREQIELFDDLVGHFDRVFPALAAPLEVMRRVAAFSRRYGLPRQFLKACHANPRFFEAVCRLFDRSRFIFELLLEHPEIIDEVLGPAYRRNKSIATHREEIRHGPDEATGDWLRLYVKAEEVRFMVRELLDEEPRRLVAEHLTRLADAVVAEILTGVEPDGELVVIALGKYGGEEMTYGSDLDLVLVGEGSHTTSPERFLRSLRRAYPVDLRLRPWGDAGALVTTTSAFAEYPLAIWERMAWTRARAVAGPGGITMPFLATVDQRVFGAPPTDGDLERMGEIRALMEREKGQPSVAGEICFKAGRGGVVDIEFLVHRWQLTGGLRGRDIVRTLHELGGGGLIPRETAAVLAGHYDFFRQVEHAVRRETNTGVATLVPAKRAALTCWLGLGEEVGVVLDRCMSETRRLVKAAIAISSFPD